MTPAELRQIIQRLGLSQVRAAQCLGVEDTTLRRWLMDPANPNARAIPETVSRIMRLADAGRLDLAELLNANRPV